MMILMLTGHQTSAPLTVILVQGSIPVTVLLSWRICHSRYHPTQLIGVGWITLGLVIALVPVLIHFNSPRSDIREMVYNTIIYFLAAIPSSASMVYRERAIRSRPMDLCYMNACVATYQFIFGLLIAPLILDLPMLQLRQRIDGFECLLQGTSSSIYDNCHYGLWILLVYILCNGGITTLIIVVMQRVSVTHMYLTAAATFPIAWIGMELYSTTSVTSLPLSWLWNTLAVICIFPGLLLYRSHLEPDTIALTLSPEEMEAASLLDNASESLIRYS